jgi:hypothetical protein
VGIGFESVPLDEEIESGQGKGEPGLKSGPCPMGDFLQMTDAMNHRQYGFHPHPGIPQTPITQLRFVGSPSLAWKAASLKTIISSS